MSFQPFGTGALGGDMPISAGEATDIRAEISGGAFPILFLFSQLFRLFAEVNRTHGHHLEPVLIWPLVHAP